MADVNDTLSQFRNLSLHQKCTIQSKSKTEDNLPYIVHMAVQTGVQTPKVATVCTDNDIRIFSRSSLKVEGELSGHSNIITDVQFGKTDPNLLFSCSTDQTVRCWDLRDNSNREIQQLKGPRKGNFEFLSMDSTHSDLLLCAGTEATEGEDTHLLFWDRRAGSLLGSYTESHDDSITKVAFKPGSDTMLVTGGADGIVCVFDINNTEEDDALQTTFNIESCVVKLGWCGEDNCNVYCATSDHRFYAWDAAEGNDQCFISRESILKEDERDYVVDCIPCATTATSHPQEALLLTGNYSGLLSLLYGDDGNKSVIATLSGGHKDIVRCLHWDDQTKTLLTGGEDSTLCLWSTSLESSIPKAVGKMKISRQTKKKPYEKTKTQPS